MNIPHKKVVAVIVGILAIGGSVYASVTMLAPKKGSFQLAEAATMPIVETVHTTGTVTATQEIPLSFESSGKVVSISAQVGDAVKTGETLISLDTSALEANLLSAESALDREKLKLASLESAGNGALGGETDAQVSVSNSLMSLKDKISDAYIRAATALGSDIDPMFSNPDNDPDFGITIESGTSKYMITGNPSQKQTVNADKKQANELLEAWTAADENLSTQDGILAADKAAKSALNSLQKLLQDSADIVNSYTPQNTSAQTVYATYQGNISAALTSIDTALSNLTAAEGTYNSSQASVSPYSISLEKTAVESAEAQVDAIKTQIANMTLVSPIDGTLSEENAKIGQVVSPGTEVASVISSGAYEIDAYVSEAGIAKVKTGEAAQITLDAYGSGTEFSGTVTAVDPAETVVNGINSYKVTIRFDSQDDRIKSGMSANVDIITDKADAAIIVPQTAIITRGTSTFVLIPSSTPDGFVEKQVTTGISDSNGNTQILSGLETGDKIATFGNQ